MNIKDINIEKINDLLKQNMTLDGIVNKRYYHSVGVAEMMVKLNKHYNLGFDDSYVYLAGLLHDCAKLISKDKLKNIIIEDLKLPDASDVLLYPSIWHAFCGKIVVEKVYNIDDALIKDAIFYHSTGRPDMNKLEQLLFISDFIEFGRVGSYFEEARKLSFINLDKATLYILENVISYLKENNYGIYNLTLSTYEYYLKLVKE